MGKLIGAGGLGLLSAVMLMGYFNAEVSGPSAIAGGGTGQQVNIVQNWFEELKERVPVP